MPRLQWDAIMDRTHEFGVDRGVLYVRGEAGVPWNGLISFTEKPTGGERTAHYADDQKYVEIRTQEEFEGTIEAFTYPDEFAMCDGTEYLQNGLGFTQQNRAEFDFSYRSMVGNGLDSFSHYKIHMVFNATATPTEKTYQTQSDTVEAMTFSWDVKTLSVMDIPGKPTSHFVVDTRKTPRKLVKALEDILYGTGGTAPRMPKASEMRDLFGSPGFLTSRNYIVDPNFKNNFGGWKVNAGWTYAVLANQRLRFVFDGAGLITSSSEAIGVVGDYWAASVEVAVGLRSAGKRVGIAVYDGSGYAAAISYYKIPSSGTITITAKSTIPLKGLARPRIFLYTFAGELDTWTLGDNFSIGKPMLTKVDGPNKAPTAYVDGSMANTKDMTYLWDGTPDASSSSAYSWGGNIVRANKNENPSMKLDYSMWASSNGVVASPTPGGALLTVSRDLLPNNAMMYQSVGSIAYGEFLHASIEIENPPSGVPLIGMYIVTHYYGDGTRQNISEQINIYPGETKTIATSRRSPGTNSTGDDTVRMIMYSATTLSQGTSFIVRNSLLEVESTFGPYFDGNTKDTPEMTYHWEGLPNASPSYARLR